MRHKAQACACDSCKEDEQKSYIQISIFLSCECAFVLDTKIKSPFGLFVSEARNIILGQWLSELCVYFPQGEGYASIFHFTFCADSEAPLFPTLP